MKDSAAAKHRPRAKFYVEKKGHFVHDAVLFMLLSVVFRIVGCWGLWTDKFFVITRILLPIGSALLFVLILRFLGDRAFSLTILPVLAGAAFFVIRALGFDNMLQAVLCIALCVLTAALYTLTAVGVIRTKWLLVPLFALALCYRVFVEDLMALRDTAEPVLFSEGMLELSIICILLGLMFTAMALKKRKLLEEANLPKIKDPVVIKPQKPAKPETPAAAVPAKPAVPAAPANSASSAKPTASATAAEKPAESVAPAEEEPDKQDIKDAAAADLPASGAPAVSGDEAEKK